MNTDRMKDFSDLDPALASDKRLLILCVDKALATGGYSFSFRTSSAARKARRRIYHVIGQLSSLDSKRMERVVFRLKGRMIVIDPKEILSSAITQESPSCPDTTSGESIETPPRKLV